MFALVGDFGEDKDAAAHLRENMIKPCVKMHERVHIDFDGVTLVTQSFIHALISDVLRINGEDVLDLLEFRNCEDVVRGIIATVVQYSLDTSDDAIEIESHKRGSLANGNGGKGKTTQTKRSSVKTVPRGRTRR
jgi:predicted signal transduction protein with EAL and GGDEF domain